MKRIIIFLSLFFFVILVYFIFTPQKVYNKKNFTVSGIIETDRITDISGIPDGFFYSDKECGYFSFENGVIHYKKAVEDELIQANSFFYIVYQKTGNKFTGYNHAGELLFSKDAYGYPYIPEKLQLYYILKTNGMGISVYSINGNAIFENISFSSMITSVDMDKNNNLLISTIDGSTYLYDLNGELLLKIDSTDSKIKIAKSSIIDSKGSRLAVCSGLYPEYVDIYNTETRDLVKRIITNNNLRYKIFMNFFQDWIFYEGINEISYYNLKKNKSGSLKIKGIISEVDFNDNGNLIILSKLNEISYITLYSLTGTLKYYKEFKNNISDINFISNDSFYFKIDSKIIKISLKEV